MEAKRLFFCLKLHCNTLKFELYDFILYFCRKNYLYESSAVYYNDLSLCKLYA